MLFLRSLPRLRSLHSRTMFSTVLYGLYDIILLTITNNFLFILTWMRILSLLGFWYSTFFKENMDFYQLECISVFFSSPVENLRWIKKWQKQSSWTALSFIILIDENKQDPLKQRIWIRFSCWIICMCAFFFFSIWQQLPYQ